MLQQKAVPAGTLDILNKIMVLRGLDPFYLAGGTALALQMGHRTSVDLDLFCDCPMENEEIIENLSTQKPIQLLSQSKNILVLNINNVKVDFVRYTYHLIRPVHHEEGLRLASIADIAAMKLAAIAGRGTKRDFVDIFFLLTVLSLKEMLGFYSQKFPDGNSLMIMRSLTYFEDAETDSMPDGLKEKIDWTEIKKVISQKTKEIAG